MAPNVPAVIKKVEAIEAPVYKMNMAESVNPFKAEYNRNKPIARFEDIFCIADDSHITNPNSATISMRIGALEPKMK